MPNKYPGVYSMNKSKTKWYYRIKCTLPNGKRVDTTGRLSEDGQPFYNAKDCYEARIAKLEKIKSDAGILAVENASITMGQLFIQYLNSVEAKSKAGGTIKKINSVWKNHIKEEFENRPICAISIQEMNDFLAAKYTNTSLTFAYVESFIKFFYLIFGYANRCNIFDDTQYNKMFVNKQTRLKMPKKRQEDAETDEIITFNDYQLKRIDEILKDSNLYCAFMIGRYTGMRISEVFALRWKENIDLENNKITVNRQLLYEKTGNNVDEQLFDDNDNKAWTLSPVKTLTSVREICIPDVLKNYLSEFKEAQETQKRKKGIFYKNTETVYDSVSKQYLSGADFVNRKPDGQLLTPDSMKFCAKKIKSETTSDIEDTIVFHFHYLRHTYATECVKNGMSVPVLMKQLGHKKLETTNKYYINLKDEALEKHTIELLNRSYNIQNTDTINPYFIELAKLDTSLKTDETIAEKAKSIEEEYKRTGKTPLWYSRSYYVLDEKNRLFEIREYNKKQTKIFELPLEYVSVSGFTERLKYSDLEKIGPVFSIIKSKKVKGTNTGVLLQITYNDNIINTIEVDNLPTTT